MTDQKTVHLLPTFQIIAEEFGNLGAECDITTQNKNAVYRSARRFYGQELQKDILYVISAEDSAAFPVNEYAFVSSEPIKGNANHICCPGFSAISLLEFLLNLFLDFREKENRIISLVYQNATLEQLCALGEELLDNAVGIHDSWFMILARSKSARVFLPESASPWELVPQHWLDDFRMDADYHKTYDFRKAELWENTSDSRNFRSIFINLYEKETYRGRLLISETNRKFRSSDYLIAELLAQQAVMLLKAKRNTTVSKNRGTDDIMYDILHGKYVAAPEFSALLKTLKWEKNDRYLCIRIQRQEALNAGEIDHVLHKDLFRTFPGSYIMFTANQQCMIINLTKTPYSLSTVRYMLSPLCRDYYQYGGISSPVEGMRELSIAFLQAQEALTHTFRTHGEQWITQFYNCALEYSLMHLNTPMQLRHLVAPQLLELIHYDREKGSQFFETFKTYMDNERDIPKTASQLIIHRTTLTYRLKKIQSMIDLNLDDPNVRLYLQLSLRMLEQEKTVRLSEFVQTDTSS